MKLVRYGPPGHERPGLIDTAGAVRDLSELMADIDGDALRTGAFTQGAVDIERLSAVSVECLDPWPPRRIDQERTPLGAAHGELDQALVVGPTTSARKDERARSGRSTARVGIQWSVIDPEQT